MPEVNHYSFSDISLLVTHYNRSSSLQRLLQSLSKLNCTFGEIIVSDDGSSAEQVSKLKALSGLLGFKLITSDNNQGLGHNINKGQDAVTLPFTLYIQEDFVPGNLFPEKLAKALAFMRRDRTLDVVKFYAYYAYPYLKPFDADFSLMVPPKLGKDYTKIYAYSDHPHLRRSDFLGKFGRYPEGIKGDQTEYAMCISFLQQDGKGLFYNDFSGLLNQENSQEEPSTMTRSSWKSSDGFAVKWLRYCYRQVRYNFDIRFKRSL